MNLSRLLPVIIFLAAGALYSIRARKLTAPAALMGVLLALAVYAGGGFTGLAMMAVFFVAGTVATSWKLSWKRQQGLAESVKGTRTAGQVFANAGVAAIAGLAAFFLPSYRVILQLLIAAAFAAATSDTLSSELGNVYGSRFYNILGFRKGQRGLNGVVSLEGSLFGLAGAALIAGVYATGMEIAGAHGIAAYAAGPGARLKPIIIIVFAGTLGNLFDSLLGATWESQGRMGNNTVNFLNTLVAALCAWLLDGLLPDGFL